MRFMRALVGLASVVVLGAVCQQLFAQTPKKAPATTPAQKAAPAALLRTAWSQDEPSQWRLRDLSDPRAGYIGAVALRSAGWRVVERLLHDNIEGMVPGLENQ